MAVIKKIGVLKTSIFLGVYSFFVGIVLSIIMWALSAVFSRLLGGLFTFSFIYILLFPILSGVISFIGSLIVIPIMNLTLKITHGINLDLELGGQTY